MGSPSYSSSSKSKRKSRFQKKFCFFFLKLKSTQPFGGKKLSNHCSMVGLIDRLRTNQRALALGSLYEVPKGNLMESWKETAITNISWITLEGLLSSETL